MAIKGRRCETASEFVGGSAKQQLLFGVRVDARPEAVFDCLGEGGLYGAAAPAVGFSRDGVFGFAAVECIGAAALSGEGDAEFDVLRGSVRGGGLGGGVDEDRETGFAVFFFNEVDAGFGLEAREGEGGVNLEEDAEDAAARLDEERLGVFRVEGRALDGGLAESREIGDGGRGVGSQQLGLSAGVAVWISEY